MRGRKHAVLIGGGIFIAILLVAIVLLVVLIPRYANNNNNGITLKGCQRRDYGSDSFVCVCAADYCDQIEEIGHLADNEMVYFVTSRDQHRLKRFSVQNGNQIEGNDGAGEKVLQLGPLDTFQSVMGFGGAFTDSVGILLNSLNPAARQLLLEAYFDKKYGIGYTIGRVPIASTDFSTRIYSYADIGGDFEMKNFAIAIEDLQYKIPHILTAQKLVGGDQLRLYASPWSPPWWMKESGKMSGGGPIKGEVVGGDSAYYKAYAKYLKLFFEDYAKWNISFWAMTLQNEPYHTIDRQNYWQALFMSAKTQRQFAYHFLSPELKSSETTANLKIMALDEQRKNVGKNADEIYANQTESSAIAGLSVHWYSFDGYKAPLQAAHSANPNKFILSGEASCGDNQKNGEFHGPELGNWTRGWMYGHDILNSMNNWVVGWVDWNLCLDLKGGPNWFGNTIDAPVVVNASAQEFYKQPMFYFLAHFGRFIPPNSMRIFSRLLNADGTEVEQVDGFFLKQNSLVEHIAFATPEGNLIAVLMNGDAKKGQQIKLDYGGKQWRISMPPDSIVTAILKK